MPDTNAWDLGGGGESFQFDRTGDEVEGFITDMSTRQGSDMQTGEPDWWDKEKTRPVMLTLLTLQTNLKDGVKDTGLRTVTLAGSKKPGPDGGKSRMCAARTAVLDATGGTAMEPGAWFKMKFVGEGPKTKPGFNPPKYFDAWYRPPVHDLDGQDRTAPANQVPATYGTGQTQPGTNWPGNNAQTAPSWAQGAAPVSGAGVGNGAAAPAADPTTGPVTMAQVEALKAINVDPAQVYGADYQSRIV